MRIGLLTIYHVPNYGSVLQAYASQAIFEKMGAACDIINYKYPNEWHWKHGAIKPRGLRAWVRRFVPSKKTLILSRFRHHYFHFTQRFNNLDEMRAADWSRYCAFVVGSDQVWNTRFVLGDSAFILSFAPKSKPKYSLASSFAMKSLPEQYREKYKRELLTFSALSVREKNGVAIINQELRINKPVEVLLDPTLLLSREEWLEAIPRSNFQKKRPYILFYMWDYAFDPKPYIFEVTKYFRQHTGYDIIALEGWKKPEQAYGLIMENRCTSSIPEFVDLFANADLVITSSFHGTAFALNFGVPLISILPDSMDDERQLSLLDSLDCSCCGVKIGTPLPEINPVYNVDDEQGLLDSIRRNNIMWINNNIIQSCNEKNHRKN